MVYIFRHIKIYDGANNRRVALVIETPADPFDIVCGDPAGYFGQPQAIVDSKDLSRAEKLQLLDEWGFDLDQRSTAADEGMIPDGASTSAIDRDVKMRARLLGAREAVMAQNDVPIVSAAVRLWKRLVASWRQFSEASWNLSHIRCVVGWCGALPA